MICIGLLGISASLSLAANSYFQSWEAVVTTLTKDAEVVAMAVDGSGNTYVAINYVVSANDDNIQLRKYSSGGTFQWSRMISGDTAGHDNAVQIAFDNVGNVYLGATVYKLVSNISRPHAFIGKYTSAGGYGFEIAYPQHITTGMAVIGDGSSAGRIGLCGIDIQSDGQRRAFFQIYNGVGGSVLNSFIGSGDPSAVVSNMVADPAGYFGYALALSPNSPWIYRMTLNGGGVYTKAVPGAGIQDLRVGVLKPSGDFAVASHGISGATNQLAFRRYDALGNTVYTSTQDVNSSVGPTGLVPLGNNGMATACRRTVSGLVKSTVLRVNAGGTVTPDDHYQVAGENSVNSLCADANDLLHIGEGLYEPVATTPQFHVVAKALTSREFREIEGEANVVAIQSNGDVMAGGWTLSSTGVRQPMLKRLRPKPITVGDRVDASSGTQVDVPAPGILANDFGATGSTLSVTVVPTHGTYVLNSDGRLRYTSDPGYIGNDTLTYKLVKDLYNSTSVVLIINHPPLQALTLSATAVVGGSLPLGTVSLSQIDASSSNVVALSDNSVAMNEPSSVTIPVNTVSAQFTISTAPVNVDTVATVSATLRGVVKTASLTILRPTISTFVLVPSSVKGGNSFNGTVSLIANAYALGVTVGLSASGGNVSIPANVTIAGGTKIGTFAGSTTAVATTQTRTITATYGVSTKTATLTITP